MLFRLLLCFTLLPFLHAQESPAPVHFEGRDLFVIQAAIPPFTAAQRAAEVALRIQALSALRKLPEVIITPMPQQRSVALIADGKLLVLITTQDAAAAGVPTDVLAQRWADAVSSALSRSRKAHSFAAYSLGALKSALAVLLFAALCWLLVRLVRWLTGLVDAWVARESSARRVRGFVLALWHRGALLVLWIAKAFAAVFLLFQFSVLLSYILSQFPQTADISTTLLDYLKDVLGQMGAAIFNYLPKGGVVIIVCFITHYAIRGLNAIAEAIEHGEIQIPGVHPEMARPTNQIVRIFVLLFALVVVFPYLPGSGSDAFKGVSILVGIIISVGSGSSIGNILAGVVLTYMRPFKTGDRVKIADTIGDVIEKSLLVTRVRNIKNVEVVIPNAAILNNQIFNYSAMARSRGLILNTTITIGYDAPWPAVHKALIDAALATEAILPDPRPFVFQTSLNDFHVSYEINAYTDRPNEFEFTYARLHQNIQDSFNRAGIEIMSPTFLALRDGNTVTIPIPNRPPGYEPPGFRIQD